MATLEEFESLRTQLAQLKEHNEALQASMETIQQKQQEKDESHHGEMDDPEPQPLLSEIWGAPILESFKPPHLSSFDGKSDPMEHAITFNTRMAVVGATDSLKCKLLAGTLTDAALCWYMNLPPFSILGYQDMTRKLIQQFSTSCHRKVPTTCNALLILKAIKHVNIINIQEINFTSSNKSQLTCIQISSINHHSGNIAYSSNSHVINSEIHP